jgi:cytochrome c553
MRWAFLALVAIGLPACDRDANAGRELHSGTGADHVAAANVKPAGFFFDGADAASPKAIDAHGERLSHVLGCRGCHTPTLEGEWFNSDSPQFGKIYASNLTRIIPTMSDAQLETLLRTGKHPTRGDLWIMPSEVFQRLSDADMKALIAHLRTVKPAGQSTPPPEFTDLGRKLIADGTLKPVSAYMAEYRDKLPPDMGPAHAFGRYLAGATCAECHGADLTGIKDFEPGLDTPDLDIAGTYSDSELATLLTTGKGKTRADLGLMTLVGKGHFSYLTPRERAAVIGYVKARAGRR